MKKNITLIGFSLLAGILLTSCQSQTASNEKLIVPENTNLSQIQEDKTSKAKSTPVDLFQFFWDKTNKAKDSARMRILDDYMSYYESIKGGINQYPGSNIKGSSVLKNKAKALPNGQVIYSFNEINTEGFYEDGNLASLQKLLIELGQLDRAWLIKQGNPGENMMIFTSKTQSEAVGCIKLFEATKKNGIKLENNSKIYVKGNKDLWQQNQEELTAACQKLVDPKSL